MEDSPVNERTWEKRIVNVRATTATQTEARSRPAVNRIMLARGPQKETVAREANTGVASRSTSQSHHHHRYTAETFD